MKYSWNFDGSQKNLNSQCSINLEIINKPEDNLTSTDISRSETVFSLNDTLSVKLSEDLSEIMESALNYSLKFND